MEERTFLDRAVDLIARAFDAFGLNGTRLRWRWNQRRREMEESGLKAAVLWRSASVPHKMCPSCRALVPRASRTCPACGAGLAAVRAPGIGRLLSNVLPGATAATSLILLVNGVLFVLMFMADMAQGRPGGPFGGFQGVTLVRFGMGFTGGEWWRLVTPMFLHGGLIHFAFNSYALLQLGPLVEQEYGTERYAVLYLLSGIGGSVTSLVLWPWDRATVGASGAICGLMGLLLAYGIRRGGAAGASIRSDMTRSAVYLVVFSLLPGIDWLCHLGGFVTGFVLGWIVPAGPFRSRRAAATWDALLLAAVLLILCSFWQVAQHGSDAIRLLMS